MIIAIVTWYVTVQLLACAALPLTVYLFRDWPDRGFLFAKILGWVLTSFVIWQLGLLGFIQFTRASVLVVIAILAGVSWTLHRREVVSAAWVCCRSWLISEIVFGVIFALGLAVRAGTPDIIGQEKFMDYALMNSLLTSSVFPAPDPWLAGFGMPYYYFGYLMQAFLAKVAGTPGPIAYNLSVATVFAVGSALSYSIVSNVTAWRTYRAWAPPLAGMIGAVMTLSMGNLEGTLEVMAAKGWGPADFWSAVSIKGLTIGQQSIGWLPADGGWWWRASRIVPTTQPDGINEFPYFSFLLGDLHPHFMALPLDLLVVGLAIVALSRSPFLDRWFIAVSAVALAVLIPANTWDVPVFWGLFSVCYLTGWFLRGGTRASLLPLAVMVLSAMVLVAPYYVGYTSQPLGLRLVDERTPAPSFLVIFGSFVAIVMTWLAVSTPREEGEAQPPKWMTLVPAVGVGLSVVCAFFGARTLGIALLLLGLTLHRLCSTVLVSRQTDRTALRQPMLTAMMLSLAFAIIAGTELVFVNDSFGTRMNTVFKFHYNAWLLLGLGCSLALVSLISRPGLPRIAGTLVGVIAVGLGCIYPLGATWTKTNGWARELTLDGTVALRAQYPNDFAAIDWLQTNRRGRGAIVEATGGDYTDFARVSTFSGLPTPIGWIGHELQWRGPQDEFTRRERLVQSLYSATDAVGTNAALDALQADYVFVGRLERDKFGASVAERMAHSLQPVVQRGDTTIYARKRDTGS